MCCMSKTKKKATRARAARTHTHTHRERERERERERGIHGNKELKHALHNFLGFWRHLQLDKIGIFESLFFKLDNKHSMLWAIAKVTTNYRSISRRLIIITATKRNYFTTIWTFPYARPWTMVFPHILPSPMQMKIWNQSADVTNLLTNVNKVKVINCSSHFSLCNCA